MHQPLPVAGIQQIDPFLLLHHHGPQVFPANNSGLPFGPHPHRGFETVTFIYEGDVQHRDSSGFSSTISKGGVQWMTTGSGLVHSESSSARFRQQGGPVELIQLWTNLPARLKMVKPNYIGLQQDQIPVVPVGEGKGKLAVVSGTWSGITGPVNPVYDVKLANLTLEAGGRYILTIPSERNVLFYQLAGRSLVNGKAVEGRGMPVFANDGDEIVIDAAETSRILLGSALPINEPVVSHGPFVMNTPEEIRQAIYDYQTGKMGVLTE
ncbi:nuclease PIN [Arsenicibacter rosenii]|uniref:Nuclease PIN n=2 Tax=Arsenicibacter rosenii TaxID=1750698 RepID=A0A1S2VRD5_9BACT|nr:nuclease PIN [Arsenicibacter rosenii]